MCMQVVAGRQVVVDWAVAKARFTDPASQPAPGGPSAYVSIMTHLLLVALLSPCNLAILLAHAVHHALWLGIPGFCMVVVVSAS